MAVDLADVDPDVLAALARFGQRERCRPKPLCPRCGRGAQAGPDGWCAACTNDQHETEKAAKRRWWDKHGREWRQARNAAIRNGDHVVTPRPRRTTAPPHKAAG